jgi:pteridine reductase
MCDIGADRPVSGYTHYSVSKAGLMMLVKAMAVELAPKIRTMGISPGQVIWPENYSETLRNQLKQRIPMKDVGTPTDVATLVRFLAVEGKYLNGEIIAVDGGLQCRY